MLRFALSLSIAMLPGAVLVAQDPESDLIARAKAIHQRTLTLDTHVDINPGNFTREKSYATRLTTQVNIPAMEEGGLDAAFFIVFVGQTQDFTATGYQKAHAAAIEKFDAIHRLVTELAPDRIELATSAADVRRIHGAGKKVALIGVENGYQLGTDLGNVERFAKLGARYLSLAHNGHSQLSDSNTGERDGVWTWHGLSPLGRKVIAELNKWGVMIDVSHPSRESMMQTVALSRAPVIASHSAVRALCNHSRNLDDEQLRAIGRSGGVAQIVAFNGYLKCQTESAERRHAIAELRTQFGTHPSEERRAAFDRRMEEINRQFPPPPRATVKDFVDHIDYAVKLIGIDHVGIASDFDGGGGVDGWSNAAETANVTIELVRRNYTEEQIGKIWGGNLLRVMEEVAAVGRELRGER